MQKKNCVLCISIGIIVCILLSACSRQPDFDAKSYVQSSLDATIMENIRTMRIC